MNITPIPDKEAAGKISVSYETIRNAVKRGDLTRIPQAGLVQHVAEEQIMLFEGMSRIVREKLPPDKLKQWHEINDAVTHSYSQQSLQNEVRNATPITIGSFNFPPKETAEYMYQNKLEMEMKPTSSGGMSFPTAQSDEADSKISISLWQAIAILAGLIALFFVLNHASQRVREKAEQELQETGLAKEDLVGDRKKSLIMLQAHPKNARRIQKIVEEAFIEEAS